MSTDQHGNGLPPLRQVRVTKGRSLRWLARETGIDVAHLSRVERGQAALSVRSLYRVAKALELTELSALLSQYDTPREPVAA